jgi:hypothetical protein
MQGSKLPKTNTASFQEVLTAHSSLLRALFLALVHQFEDDQAALDQFVGEAKRHLDTGQYDPKTIAGAKRYLDHFRRTMSPTPEGIRRPH